jgi:hypothetical protein
MNKTLILLLTLALTHVAYAYPEFQRFSQEHGGQPINCAMCHTSGDGRKVQAAGKLVV